MNSQTAHTTLAFTLSAAVVGRTLLATADAANTSEPPVQQTSTANEAF